MHAPSKLPRAAYVTLTHLKLSMRQRAGIPIQLISHKKSNRYRADQSVNFFLIIPPIFSISALKPRAQLDNLSHHRRMSRLSLLRHLSHHPYLHQIFEAPTAFFPTTEHILQIKRITCHSVHYANSFIHRTIVAWNYLPSHIANSAGFATFQEHLRKSYV